MSFVLGKHDLEPQRPEPVTGADGQLRQALAAFVDCIDAVGGVKHDEKGFVALVTDEDWIDLGDTYLTACAALDRKPVVEQDTEENQ